MTKVLTPEQIAAFERDGYLFPFDCMTTAEAQGLQDRLEAFEREIGADAGTRCRVKAHLGFPWMVALAKNPAILDVVEDLIGPDIILYLSALWSKPAHDPGFVSWHQDSAYYGIAPHDEVTVWFAFSDATVENGCLRVIPGSHLGPDHDHVETYDEKNLLSRGQTIVDVDDSTAVHMELRAGQFSVHHERLIHGSVPNNSGDRRLGMSFVLLPAHCRSVIGRRAAILLRGRDKDGNWDADPVPRFDQDPVALAAMKRAQDGYVDPAHRTEAERAGSV